MTDPFYLYKSYNDAHPEAPAGEKKVYGSEGFSPEDITGADYIILNHVHADHCSLVGMLWEKFKGRVLVPGPCALELAKTFRIPTQAIYPIFPGNTYYFDDFTLIYGNPQCLVGEKLHRNRAAARDRLRRDPRRWSLAVFRSL